MGNSKILTKEERALLNKKDKKLSFLFMIIAGVAGLLTSIYQFSTLTPEQIGSFSKETIIVTITMQVALLYGLVLSYFGLKLCRATNLDKGILESIKLGKKYKINLENVKIAVCFGFLNAALITICEKFIFAKIIPEIASTEPSFSLLYLFSGILYGGVVEEIILRLFLMSLVVFTLYKIFARRRNNDEIPTSIYWVSIIVTSIIFAIGHLPATYAIFNVTIYVLIRVLLLNAFAGILFGYLYWKKGIEYSMMAHMLSHIFMQLLFIPILF